MIQQFLEYISECEKEGQYSETELNFDTYEFTCIIDCIRSLKQYSRIGIYGTGLHSERFIKVLLKYGLINKVCCFIDESRQKGEFFSFPLENNLLEACQRYRLEMVLISSKRYEEDIYKRIIVYKPEQVSLCKIYDVRKTAEERVYFIEDEELGIYKKFDLLQTYKAHLNRYGFALGYVRGKVVLDMACGSGYGSRLLAQKAKTVYGVDIDGNTINFALKHHKKENIVFINEAIENLTLPEKADVVVSFETIEHIYDSKTYFERVLANLKPEGIFIVSTPLMVKDGINPINKFHVNEYTLQRFNDELKKRFSEIDYYSQQYKNNGGICIDDGNFRLTYGDHTFAIAVCYR